jgi:hypothetical protein
MNRTLRTAVAAVAVSMIGLVVTAVPASAAPKAGHGHPSIREGPIQAALDAATGDTVDVAPGT